MYLFQMWLIFLVKWNNYIIGRYDIVWLAYLIKFYLTVSV